MPWKRQKFRLRPWMAIIPLLILGAAAAYKFRGPLMKPVVRWRAEQLLERAEKAGKTGDWDQAYRRALAAHQLNSNSLLGRKLLFESASNSRRPTVAVAAASLFNHTEATLEDKARALRAIMDVRDLPGFVSLYQKLDEKTRRLPEFQLEYIRFLAAIGALPQARQLLEQQLEKNEDGRSLLLMAMLLIHPSASDENVRRGQRIVSNLLAEPPPINRQAFELLSILPISRVHPDALRPDVLDWYQSLEDPQPREHLAAAAIRLAQAPEDEHETVYRDVIDTVSESDPEILAEWLYRQGRADLMASFLDDEVGRKSLPLYLFRLQVLLSKEGLEAAQEWLEDPHPEASLTEISVARARITQAQGNRQIALQRWEEAFQNAAVNSRQNDYVFLYRSAVEGQEPDLAVRAILMAARRSPSILPSSSNLMPVMSYLNEQGRLAELRDLTEVLLSREPDNVVLRNNFAYLSVLLSDDPKLGTRMAQELYEKFPTALPSATTYAFGLIQSGRPKEALEVLQGEKLEWDEATPADLSIRALVWEHNDMREKGSQLREEFDNSSLSIIERRALSPPPLPEPEATGTETKEEQPVEKETASPSPTS